MEPFRALVNQKSGPFPPSMRHTHEALEVFRTRILTALNSRFSKSWNISDFTAAGALIAVAGGITKETDVLNTGLVTAGIGLTADSRYAMTQQINFSLNTLSRLNCIYAKLAPVTPQFEELIRESSSNQAKTKLAALPETVIRQVEIIQQAHLERLYTLRPSEPDKATILEFFYRYSKESEPDPSMKEALTGKGGESEDVAREAEINAAAKLVQKMALEVEACVKLSPT